MPDKLGFCIKCEEWDNACTCVKAKRIGDGPDQTKPCTHILGLAFWKDELDVEVREDNVKEVKEEYNHRLNSNNSIEWFKMCPYCGEVMKDWEGMGL